MVRTVYGKFATHFIYARYLAEANHTDLYIFRGPPAPVVVAAVAQKTRNSFTNGSRGRRKGLANRNPHLGPLVRTPKVAVEFFLLFFDLEAKLGVEKYKLASRTPLQIVDLGHWDAEKLLNRRWET